MILLTMRRRYLAVWISLMLLLAVTSIAARHNLGWGNVAVSMTVAGVKAVLIAVFFMHILKGDSALRLTIVLPIFLFFLLVFLGLADFRARQSHDAPWRAPDANAEQAYNEARHYIIGSIRTDRKPV